jgi:hypothetical protein
MKATPDSSAFVDRDAVCYNWKDKEEGYSRADYPTATMYSDTGMTQKVPQSSNMAQFLVYSHQNPVKYRCSNIYSV